MAKQTVNLGTSPNKGDGDPIRTAMRKINENFDELYAGNFADPENTASNIIPSTDGTYDLGSADKAWADLHVKDFIYIGGVRLEASGNTILIGGDVVAREDTVGSLFGDDSTLLVDGISNTINLDGTVAGDIIPNANEAYDLGSASNRFRDLYLSGSTIDLGGVTLSVVGGDLQLGGVKIPTQTDLDTVADVSGDYNNLINTPTIPSNLNELADINTTSPANGDFLMYANGEWVNAVLLNNIVAGSNVSLLNNDAGYVTAADIAGGTLTVDVNNTGDLTGSVFADDSTLLVDGVAGKIVGPIDTAQQARFTDSILLQNGNDLVTIGGASGASFSLPGKNFSVLGGDAENGNYNINFNTAGISMLSTGDHNFLSAGQTIIGAATGITLNTKGFINLTNDVYDDTFYGGITTDKSLMLIAGADYLGDTDSGGGVIISGGNARNDGTNGNVIIQGGNGGTAGTGIVSILGAGLAVNAPIIGYIDGDLQGSVFGDDSTILVDGVAGKIIGEIDTANGSISNITTTNLYAANSQGVNITANGFNNLVVKETEVLVQNVALKTNSLTSIDGTLNINGDVDFGNSGTIDFTGATITGTKIGSAGSIEFETENDPNFWSNGSINTQDYSYIFNFPTNQSDATAPLLIGWNDRPYLKPFLETSIGASEATQGVFKRSISIEGGNATETRVPGNVYLTFGRNISAATFGDIIIGNAGAGDIFIGKDPANNTSHTGTINIGGNNSSTALRGDVDFANATITNWEDPNVVNKANDSSQKIVVGSNTAVMDFLTVRVAENTPGQLDVEFNYDAGGTVAVSANGDVANRFNGTTTFAAGNTTWTVMNVLTTVGDKGEFTIVDHSGHKIYRVTTFAGVLPGIPPGEAYCVIERLK